MTVNGRLRKSTSVTSSAIISVPKRSACFWNVSISSGPVDAVDEARVVLDSVVSMSWPPGWMPVNMTGDRLARAA